MTEPSPVRMLRIRKKPQLSINDKTQKSLAPRAGFIFIRSQGKCVLVYDLILFQMLQKQLFVVNKLQITWTWNVLLKLNLPYESKRILMKMKQFNEE